MMKKTITYRPVGVIRSQHVRADQTPIQPVYAKQCRGRAEIFPPFEEALSDLEGFSHIFLIYHFHRAHQTRLMVKPFLQDVERGVFATRAPGRPNPIGLSLVKLVGRKGRTLYLEGLDILDGTPLLDIKPFIRRFDRAAPTRNGWQDEVDEKTARKRGRRTSGKAKG